ncbi:MAG: UDP-N-acetylmuramoyl-tripeptide--D-alanyl-D-alanine ligase [Flavobacteriaceae bacterium]|nr:UDP-N-acetylmuramoyl-tripeptide--D-alanyl-D-alanine ligase [Flavobacteriaceae bacterium]
MNINTIYSYFLACNSVCTDTRKIKENDMFFALKGANFNGNKFAEQAILNGAKYAVIDEKEYQNKNTILVEDVLTTLQELGTHHRKKLNIPIIALTGSNGKTTTKELINSVLSKKYRTTATQGNYNNHIGVPLTLLSLTDQTEIGVVEMGANHLNEIKFLCNISLPDYGLITNFGKAHLEGFGGIKGVIKGKSEIYDHLIAYNKTVFINTDDALQVKQINDYSNQITYGSGKNNDCIVKFKEANPFVILHFKKEIIKSKLIGDYNFSNVAVAIAIGDHFKIDVKDIKDAIENYLPVNNRSEIFTKGTNTIILDAYNANPTSMKAALDNLAQLTHQTKIAILGDMFELGIDTAKEHQSIADYASELNLNDVYFVGENFASVSTHHKQFESFEDFESSFSKLKINHASILIKGSRGMQMERILDFLR